MSATVASCHAPTGGTTTVRRSLMRSIALIALLEPGIATVVIPAHLPEAGFIVVQQRDDGAELGALPEVEVWDEPPCRTAVVRRQRLAVVLERDPCFASG